MVFGCLYIIVFLSLSLLLLSSAQESLILTAVAKCSRCGGTGTADSAFEIFEFTACAKLADLNHFKFAHLAFRWDYESAQTYYPSKPNLTNFPTKESFYVIWYTEDLSVDRLSYFFYFDFGNKTVFVRNPKELDVAGLENMALSYDGTVVDVFGGNDTKSTEIQNGWAVRRSGSRASPNFDVNEWTIMPDAFRNQPKFNSQANNPLTFGTFECNPLKKMRQLRSMI